MSHFTRKLIHKFINNLCKNDTSKLEPEQSKGYVSFVLSVFDPNDKYNSENECLKLFFFAWNNHILQYLKSAEIEWDILSAQGIV